MHTAAEIATMLKKYDTRGKRLDYRAMSDTVLPRTPRLHKKKQDDTLYPVEILERE